ncbi:MAG: zinc ABC transporter substrate-binding protein [Bacteroidales bacterium]|nr:zinc ABC transporter substrate-binding protein [Bacteroidales bacterium]
MNIIPIKIMTFAVAIILFSCKNPKTRNNDDDKQVITVSILPQKTFIEKIAGDDFHVNILLPPGASPASFTLLPSQLKDISTSKIWMRIGYIGFEFSWQDKIKQANPDMKVLDLSENLDLISTENISNDNSKSTAGINPHIWLSPKMVKQISRRITDELSILKPERKDVYEANYEKFCKEINILDAEIRNVLEKYEDRTIIIFHPILTYYARDYGLIQESLEPGGKEPTPQRMAEVINLAKTKNIRVIYIQSEFDIEQASVFAEEINGKIIEVNPLSPEWAENLREITQIITENFVE